MGIYSKTNKIKSRNQILIILSLASLIFACTTNEQGKGVPETNREDSQPYIVDTAGYNTLSKSLTFHASFDNGANADFALGDEKIYSGKTVGDEQKPASYDVGLGDPPLTIVQGKGKYGSALEFTKENSHVVFYKAEKNIAYSTKNFSGTLSFWLKLNPQKIPQTYTDPIQLTDKDYSNSAIWIDFTKNDTPSDFRLGIFGEQKIWDKKNKKGLAEAFFWRLLKIVKPPFSEDKWTHVAVIWEGLNTNKIARGKLYFDGVFQGETGGITEPFVWDISEATIRLGTGPFVGMFDEIAIFNRTLTNDEVSLIYKLKKGVGDLRIGSDL